MDIGFNALKLSVEISLLYNPSHLIVDHRKFWTVSILLEYVCFRLVLPTPSALFLSVVVSMLSRELAAAEHWFLP